MRDTKWWPVVSPGSRFANVLCRSAKKRKEPSLSHDTKKCDTHVYTSFFQPVIWQKQLGNWPNTYAEVSEQNFGETTVNNTKM